MKKILKNIKTEGFTLVELMIVVAIVAILAAIAVPMYGKYIKKSRTSEATANLGAMTIYEETFYSENDYYQVAAPNPTSVPSPTQGNLRLNFDSTQTGWASLGNVVPNGTPLYFQYQIVAGQYTSAGGGAFSTSNGLLNPASLTRAGGSYCTNNLTAMDVSASTLSIPTTSSSNWFYATATGDQDGDKICSLFIKVIDRPDIVVERDIE